MQSKIETEKEVEEVLYNLSERYIQNIEKTTDIHLKLDPPDNILTNADDYRLYRMRKVIMHALMIVALGGHNDNLHALAVECRVAQEQLNILLGKNLKHVPLYDDLSPYVHPSSILLVYPKSMGGLSTDHDIRIHATRLMMIGNFGIKYAYSLSYLANDLNKDLFPEVADIVFDFTGAIKNLPPVEEFNALLKEKSEDGKHPKSPVPDLS